MVLILIVAVLPLSLGDGSACFHLSKTSLLSVLQSRKQCRQKLSSKADSYITFHASHTPYLLSLFMSPESTCYTAYRSTFSRATQKLLTKELLQCACEQGYFWKKKTSAFCKTVLSTCTAHDFLSYHLCVPYALYMAHRTLHSMLVFSLAGTHFSFFPRATLCDQSPHLSHCFPN